MDALFNKVTSLWSKAIRDPEEVRAIYKDKKLMPYAGDSKYSAHRVLTFIDDLAGLSPSKNAVINFYQTYGFGAGIDLVNRQISGLNLQEKQESIDDDDKKRIARELRVFGFDFSTVYKITQQQVRDNRICGNFYKRYEEIEINGEKRVRIDYVSPLNWMYEAPESAYSPRKGYIFKKTGFNTSREDKIEAINVYPFFTKTATGRKCIIHDAHFVKHGGIYGWVPDEAAISAMFIEQSSLNFACRVSNKDILTKLLVFTPRKLSQQIKSGGVASSGVGRTNEEGRNYVVRRLMNQDSEESETVGFIDYPEGEKPEFKTVDIKRDSDWFKTQINTSSELIFSTNGIDRTLVGRVSNNGKLSAETGSSKMASFRIDTVTSVCAEQERHESSWNLVFSLMSGFTGITELDGIGFKFVNKLQSLSKIENEAKANSIE